MRQQRDYAQLFRFGVQGGGKDKDIHIHYGKHLVKCPRIFFRSWYEKKMKVEFWIDVKCTAIHKKHGNEAADLLSPDPTSSPLLSSSNVFP
jgi:hypothetical protein